MRSVGASRQPGQEDRGEEKHDSDDERYGRGTGVSRPRQERGTAEALARALTEDERALELPCWVRHPSAGGSCPRRASTIVYGLLFCEVHGAEARAGALEELYGDACDYLERLDNTPRRDTRSDSPKRVSAGPVETASPAGLKRGLRRNDYRSDSSLRPPSYGRSATSSCSAFPKASSVVYRSQRGTTPSRSRKARRDRPVASRRRAFSAPT